MVELLESHQIPHFTMKVGSKSLNRLFTIRKLADFFVEYQPHIVHGRSRLPDWLCHYALKRVPYESRPKFVTSVHGLHSVSTYSAVITKGALIEAVSNTAKEYLIQNYANVDESKIRLIHRGVNPEDYYPTFEPDRHWMEDFQLTMSKINPNNLPLIVLVGRVSRLKGHNDFLKVVEKLNASTTPVIGLIVGGDDKHHAQYVNELKNIVNTNPSLQKSIFFLGHRDDVREIISQSNIVLSLSAKPESFGRTVLEALSLGTPAVGYEQGGVGEILAELFPEGSVPTGDVDTVVCKIQKLLHRKVDVHGHKFTLDNMCAQTLAIYQELVQ